MLFVSWNVAALSTTLSKIDEDYSFASAQILNCDEKSIRKKKTCRCHAFQYFLHKHHDIDILCIQEHKIPLSQLSSRGEAFGVANGLEEYESFWSCNAAKRGFNGVVTFAKKGLVKSACSTPLGISDLDNQGRVLLTDHGKFVLFNVYAPASCGHSLTDKMRFLNALRRAMRKQREEYGKAVVLAGDYNISHMASDRFWKYQLVNVNKVIQDAESCSDKSDFPLWKIQLTSHWDEIRNILETKQTIKTNTKNPATGEVFTKYRVQVRKGNKYILLGTHEQTEKDALYHFDFSSDSYFDHDLNQECIAKEENLLCIDTLCELMLKLVNINWEATVQRTISKEAGVNPSSPTIRWFNQLLEEDSMVDTFRYFYPTAQGRFTCWNQSVNARYRNQGSRIDYILVDKSLLPDLCKGETGNDITSLNSGIVKHLEPLGEDAALLAATANHNYKPAAFGGGGIMTSPPQHILDSQFGSKHTGIIYTPPNYSDHVAVSALFTDESGWIQRQILDDKDAQTRKAQPHKSQSSIASFLKKSNDNKGNHGKGVTSDTAQIKSYASSKVDAGKVHSENNVSSKRPQRNESLNAIQSTKKKKCDVQTKKHGSNSIFKYFPKK